MSSNTNIIRKTTFDFANEVIEFGAKIFPKEELEKFKTCIQCGKCVGGCPSGRRTGWRVRRTFEETLLGLKEKVFSDDNLWNCTTCYTCTDRCPQDVKPTDVIKAIRNIAVAEGYMLVPHQKVALKVLETGHAVPLDKESWENLREKVGIERVPPNASAHPEAIEEIRKIAKKIGFDKLVEEKEE